jgi:hypothetical protein
MTGVLRGQTEPHSLSPSFAGVPNPHPEHAWHVLATRRSGGRRRRDVRFAFGSGRGCSPRPGWVICGFSSSFGSTVNPYSTNTWFSHRATKFWDLFPYRFSLCLCVFVRVSLLVAAERAARVRAGRISGCARAHLSGLPILGGRFGVLELSLAVVAQLPHVVGKTRNRDPRIHRHGLTVTVGRFFCFRNGK